MYEIQQTDVFEKWLSRLRDVQGKARILARLEACQLGHLGDTKSIGGGISAFRIHAGPGYRVYFTQQGETIILLLCAGDKSSQPRDIERAKRLLTELEGE